MTTSPAENTSGMIFRCSNCEEQVSTEQQLNDVLEQKVIQCETCGSQQQLSDAQYRNTLRAAKAIKGYAITGGIALALGMLINAASLLGMIESDGVLLGNGLCIALGVLVVSGLRKNTAAMNIRLDEPC